MPSQKTGVPGNMPATSYIQPVTIHKKPRSFVCFRQIYTPPTSPRFRSENLFFFSAPGWGQASSQALQPGLYWCFFFLFKMGLCTSGVCLVPVVSQAVPVSLDFTLETYPTSKQIGSLAWKLSFSLFLAATKPVSKQRLHSETCNHQLFLHVHLNLSRKTRFAEQKPSLYTCQTRVKRNKWSFQLSYPFVLKKSRFLFEFSRLQFPG